MSTFMTERPLDPDSYFTRGTDAYNDAITNLHRWVAQQLIQGKNMEDVVDKYDDFGNISHDWKEWNNWGGGFHRPREWDEEMYDLGDFKKRISKKGEDGGYLGDYTLDPESGYYFNDVGNDQLSRVWYDEFGQKVGGPEGRGPKVEYGPDGRLYFVDAKKQQMAPKGETTYNGPVKAPGTTPARPTPHTSFTGTLDAPSRNNAWGSSSSLSYGARPSYARGPAAPSGFDTFGAPQQNRRPAPVKSPMARGFY